MTRDARRASRAPRSRFDSAASTLARGARTACCACPTVADKTFLDHHRRSHRRRPDRARPDGRARGRCRSPTARVTAAGFDVTTGEAMAMGERTPRRAARRGRLGAHGGRRGDHQHRLARRSRSCRDVKLSANWMAAAGHPGEDARLYDAVRAVGMELCPALGIAIPVGKDSMSMRTVWQRDGEARERDRAAVADRHRLRAGDRRAPRADARAARATPATTELLLIDLGARQEPPRRLGAGAGLRRSSATAPPDLDDPGAAGAASSPRSRSSTPAGCCSPTTTAPTAACSRRCWRWRSPAACGLDVDLDARCGADPLARAVHRGAGRGASQVRAADVAARASRRSDSHGLGDRRPRSSARARRRRSASIVRARRASCCSTSAAASLRGIWSETTHAHAGAARRPDLRRRGAGGARSTPSDPGLIGAPDVRSRRGHRRARSSRGGARPRVAILREQGVNGQIEMAAAFDRAGFEAVDVHMSDLLAGRASTSPDFQGARRLRRLLATATCSAPARAGPSRSCFNAARARRVRGVLRARRTPSRSASATAAR